MLRKQDLEMSNTLMRSAISVKRDNIAPSFSSCQQKGISPISIYAVVYETQFVIFGFFSSVIGHSLSTYNFAYYYELYLFLKYGFHI